MAGGALLPASWYYGGGNGFVYPTFYIPATNTNLGGALEAIGVVASLSSGSTAPVVLQFNLPENLPTGVAKLRVLSMANATSGVAKFTIQDAVTPAGSNIGASALSTEAQTSITWSSADVLVENKITLGSAMVANSILTCIFNPNSTGAWTLAAASAHQPSLVWE